MKAYNDCISCFLIQALKVSRITSKDEKVHRQILNKVMERLIHVSLEVSPPEIAQTVYSTIKEITKNPDPYKEAKQRQNKLAMAIYPEIKAMIAESKDPLFLSVRLAIAGNIIDLGINKEIKDIKREVISCFKKPLSINHYAKFKEKLNNSEILLYLGDNAGEIVFDKILIEEIKKVKEIKVYFVVRGAPIINDATVEDANFVMMEEVAKVVSNGFDAPATILSKSLPIIPKLFSQADMIISKGQGNYEALSDEEKNIFFLLKVKCPIVSRDLGVVEGSGILKSQI